MMQGTLEVTVGEATYALSAGDVIKFQTDQQHISFSIPIINFVPMPLLILVIRSFSEQ